MSSHILNLFVLLALGGMSVMDATGATAAPPPNRGVDGETVTENCGPDVFTPVWPWPNAGEVRQSKERVFCYQIVVKTGFVAAPGGVVSDELFAEQHDINLSVKENRERRWYSFRGRRDGFFYSYSILDRKPVPISPAEKPKEINGSVQRLVPPTAPVETLSSGFMCDREEKWCVLFVFGDGHWFSARFDAQTPDGVLCFRVAAPRPNLPEPKLTITADGQPIVENAAINERKSNHCMGAESGQAITQMLDAKTLTFDVVRAPPDGHEATDHRTLRGEAKRLTLLFDVTKFVYAHAVVGHDRPDAQRSLKVQVDKLLRAKN